MNLFQISVLCSFTATVTIGALVFFAQLHRRINQAFFILTMVLTAWLMALGFSSVVDSVENVMFWIRQSSAISALIPVAMNMLRLAMSRESKSWLSLALLSKWWLIFYFPVAVICQTQLFLISAKLPSGEQLLAQPIYGPGFPVFGVYMVLSLIALVYLFNRDRKKAEGILRAEINFVLLGCTFGLFFGVLFLIISSITGSIDSGWPVPLSPIIFASFLAYGIAARRILDIPNVIRRLIAYTLLFTYLCLVYFAVYFLGKWVIPHTALEVFPIHHLLATILVAASLAPAQGRLQSFANQLFVGIKSVDVGALIQRSSRMLNSISTLDELTVALNQLVREAVDTEKIHLLLDEGGSYVEKRDGQKSDKISALDHKDPIIAAVSYYREALVRAMIGRMRPDPLLTQAEHRMKELGIELIIGIYSKAGVEGVLLLGPRMSGKIYGSLEQQAIEGLSGQLAVSLDNAKLYTEVQNSRIYNDILLDRLVGGVIAVNTARVVTVFNREAQRITEMMKDDIINTAASNLPAALRDGLEQAFNMGGNRDVEAVLINKSGKEVPLRYGCTLFHSHTGKALGALIVFTDQTELKKLEYQIRRTDRLASLGTLAAGMAHEIKNPLVSLKTFSQLLPERYEDPDFRDTFSILLGEEVSRIDRIVNQLLRFARPAKPSLIPVGLHSVVDNTLNLVKQQMRQHNISVIRQYRADPDRIYGDGDMLVQAILNFFLNAIDAMGDKGELIVRTEIIQESTNQLDLWGRPVQTPRLRLSIIDSGKGISEQDILHVFDPFFTTKATGTGLGLSVSHGIIQEHNGVIDVESELNKGTSLHVVFPLLSQEVST